MNDERRLELALRSLPATPETPRERMWERITAARAAGAKASPTMAATRRPRFDRTWRRAGACAAVAAVLVLAFAAGRWSRTASTTAPNAAVPTMAAQSATTSSERRAAGYREAATQLFDRAEIRLVGFQSRPTDADVTAATTDWATGLLTQTRLLLDSPAADEPDTRRLLRELELVLAQIAALPDRGGTHDAARIVDGLNERATLQRLRIAGAL